MRPLLAVLGLLVSSSALATPPRSEACPGHRYIGLARDPGCPTPKSSNWTAAPLFDPHDSPEALRGFCSYEWKGIGSPRPRSLPRESGRPGTEWLQPDCQVVAGLAHPLTATFAPAAVAAFEAQVDPAVTYYTSNDIRIDVLDSAGTRRDDGPGEGMYAHGRSLGLIARKLTSGPFSFTRPDVHHTLALPIETAPFHPDPDGGFYGSFQDLARGIFEAVRYAKRHPEKLVLNLSLGWSSRWNQPSAWYPLGAGPEAVLRALRYASCEGALIIVAAGNAGHGPSSVTGPMYPAAWASESAPNQNECVPYETGRAAVPLAGLHRPLLFAVSGVDGEDHPLANARPGGHARLVAPGQLGMTRDGYGDPRYGPYSLPLTGSSVAAIVASSAAAVVWSENPSWTPHQVMDLVYAGSVPLGRNADFGLGAGMEQRRVSLCGAQTAARLAEGRGHPSCSVRGPGVSATPRTVLLPSSAVAYRASASALVTSYNDNFCGARVLAAGPSSARMCPSKQLETPEELPWVGPLPSYPECAVCLLQLLEEVAIIGLDSSVTEMTEPTLHLENEVGPDTIIDLSSLGFPSLIGTKTYVLKDLGLKIDPSLVLSAHLEGVSRNGKETFFAPLTLTK